MTKLTHTQFLKTLPELVIARLPEPLQGIKVHQPYHWLIQFNYGEQRLHYEVSSAKHRPGWELGFHCEAGDHNLNRYLLMGFRRHLFEIKDILGPTVEAEMWDKGWTKIYEVYPTGELNKSYQEALGRRMAEFIICLHPIYIELRNNVANSYR
ncbi:MAG: hypothetical protein IPM53_20430 [Anaerolineaceae bacterium]|nr:hypothetical protein [Anaerolineaceae bacterium]